MVRVRWCWKVLTRRIAAGLRQNRTEAKESCSFLDDLVVVSGQPDRMFRIRNGARVLDDANLSWKWCSSGFSNTRSTGAEIKVSHKRSGYSFVWWSKPCYVPCTSWWDMNHRNANSPTRANDHGRWQAAVAKTVGIIHLFSILGTHNSYLDPINARVSEY